MKALLILFVVFAVGPALHAQADHPEGTFFRQVVALVKLAPTNYSAHRGVVANDSEGASVFTVTSSYDDMYATEQFITVLKPGPQAYYSAAYTEDVAVANIQKIFLGLPALFSGPGKNDYEGFTAGSMMTKQPNGSLTDILYYKGVAVAVLSIPANGKVATLYIGLVGSKNLTADLAVIASIPAQSVVTSKDSGKSLENVLRGEFANEKAAKTTPPAPSAVTPVDGREEAFCRQLITLVRLAPSDYRDHRGPVAEQNFSGELYSVRPAYPNLNSTKQFVRAYKNGTRSYFYATYSGEAAIAGVQSTFLHLSVILSRPGNDAFEGFTADSALRPEADGELNGFIFYKGIIVGKLTIPAKRDEATLFIGLLFSENMTRDLAVLNPNPVPLEPAKPSWGSPLADALMQLHHSANSGYDGRVGERRKQSGQDDYFSATPILGADDSKFWLIDDFDLCLMLTYNKTNPVSKQAEKEVKAFFSELTKSGHYRVGAVTDRTVHIEEDGRDVLAYWISPEKKDSEYLTIGVYQTLPILADEATYGGKYPVEPTSSAAPQIREIKGKGNSEDSFERDNGIFREGKLFKGSKTFHGYGDFLDGVWYSEEWGKSPGRSYEVIFHPAYSVETIYGHFTTTAI